MASTFSFQNTGSYYLILTISITLACLANGQANFTTVGNFTATRYLASGNNIISPRGILRDESDDILVVSSGPSQITAIYQENNKITSTVILEEPNLCLNHGIAFNDGYLYASSDSTVYRWPYRSGQRTRITSANEVVIKNIPAGGEHKTRTLVFDSQNTLYVSVGSAKNIYRDNERARILKFNLSQGIPSGGFDFGDGTIFAIGLRNQVGLAFDGNGLLWGVECSADNLIRPELGNDVGRTNPADELTIFNSSLGANYGYPYCWTVDRLEGHKWGSQLAWPDFMDEILDAYCQNQNNNIPPTLPLPAHSAPLGITFYDGNACSSSSAAFPCSMKGDAFIAFHGSQNITPPVGYKVVHVPIDHETGRPTGKISDVMSEQNPASCGNRCFRPVDLVFDSRGYLIVTADATNEVFRITYGKPQDPPQSSKGNVLLSGIMSIALVLPILPVYIGKRI